MERNPWWRGNLPAETSGFIGREIEIRELLKLQDETSLVTVTGGGGGGRSRIAVKASEEWAARLNFSITDIRLALDSGDPAAPMSIELAGMLRILWSCLGRSSEGRHYTGRSIDAAPVTDPGLPRLRWADGATVGEPLALVTVAMAATWRGEFTEAVSMLEEVRRLCDARGERWARASGDYVLSIAQLGLGRVAEAAVSARQSLDVKWRFRDATGVALAADQLAVIAAVQGDGYRTARLQGAGVRLRAMFGLREFGSEGMSEPRTVAERTARQLLGDDAYDAAFAEGHDDDPDSAVAYALG
ncbi:hypothetical protein [Streptosporangium roseum]|uniref:hypothetical protein n=1 Tax=Streptosporangium roseum TaxID=2001 RepID=UPI00331C6377